MALRFLTITLVVCTIVGINGHFHDPRTASITISTKSVERNTVEMNDGDTEAKCTFQYETNPKSTMEQTVAVTDAPKATSAVSVLEQLNSQCVKSQVDYWAYEICLGGGIRQYHQPDSYQLGTFSRWEGETQVYSNGAPCEARPDRQPRQVVVKFACSSGAPLFLSSIRETQTCEYEAVVAAPSVCQFSQFPVVTGTAMAAPSGGMSEIPVNDGSEEWLVQLSKLVDGRFMCQVYSTETHSSSSELNFSQFAVHIAVNGVSTSTTKVKSPTIPPPELRNQYVVRQPGRGHVSTDELLYEVGQNERFSTIANSEKFGGKLAYVVVMA